MCGGESSIIPDQHNVRHPRRSIEPPKYRGDAERRLPEKAALLHASYRRFQKRERTSRAVPKTPALGLARGGLLGLLLAAYGIDRTVRVWSGRSLWRRLMEPKPSPRLNGKRLDPVDEGSRLSFPASDPPAAGL